MGAAWQTCPRCGHYWRPFAGSKLPCHARCLFSEAAEDDFAALLRRFSRLTYARLANDLGISTSTLRSITRRVDQRRAWRAARLLREAA